MAPLVKIYPRLFPWNSGPLRTHPVLEHWKQKRRRSVDRRASERTNDDWLVGQVRGGKGKTLSQKDAKRASERANCVCQPWQVVARRKAPAVYKDRPEAIFDPRSSLSASSRDPELQCALPVRASPWVDHLGSTRIFLKSPLPSLDERSLSTAGQPVRQASNGWMDRGWERRGEVERTAVSRRMKSA